MSFRAALLLTALPTLAAAQDIDTGEIHACVASCLAGRSTAESAQYGQCITDLCASLATGTGAALEMAEAGAEDADIRNETLLILGDEPEAVEVPTPQPVVSANAGVNQDVPSEANAGGDATMNAVPVPVEVDEPAAGAIAGSDDGLTADAAQSPAEDAGEDAVVAADPGEADMSDEPMDADGAEATETETAGEDAMGDGIEMAEDDAMADDAMSPDAMADDAAAGDAMAADAIAAGDAMAEDSMTEDATADDAMAEDATADATNQVISGETPGPDPVVDPVSAVEWQVVTLSASEAPWVDGYGALVGGEGDLQFGYLCARAGVSHLSLAGEAVATRPGVYTVVVGPGQYLTPPMVATGGRLQAGISPNDPLLAALRAGNAADVYGPDRSLVARFVLKGSSAAIATALDSCF